jgi:hypothetical protein
MSFQDFTSLKTPRIEPERALRLGVGAAAFPLWAAFFAAAGAGAAYWWATSWTRRPQEGVVLEPVSFAPSTAEAPEIAEPEAVMAHQPEPETAPTPAEDPATDALAVAPEEVMEHAPVDAVAAPAPASAKSEPVEPSIAAPAALSEDAAPTSPAEAVHAAVEAIAAEAAPKAPEVLKAPKAAKGTKGGRRAAAKSAPQA